MLEEAAGIAGLHARRKDAEQKLRATEANLAAARRPDGRPGSARRALRRQARAAERYRALTDKIRLAEARLVFARWREADRAASAAAEEAEARRGRGRRGSSRRCARAQALQEQAAARAGRRARRGGRGARCRRALAHQLATARGRARHGGAAARRPRPADQALAAETAREAALDAMPRGAVDALDRSGARSRRGWPTPRRIAARIAAELTAGRGARRARPRRRSPACSPSRRRCGPSGASPKPRSRRRATQAARVDAERQRLAEQLAALGDGSEPNAGDRRRRSARREQRRARARRGRSATDARRAGARPRRPTARDDARERARRRRAPRLSAATVRARRAGAGARPVAAARRSPSSRAAPGYERALAAALGDDLDAALGGDGPRRWDGQRAARRRSAACPQGSSRLLDHVEAPAALAARLAQVGVADSDDGAAARGRPAAGHPRRRAAPLGRLRRHGGGAAAAERLMRANRLAELDRRCPASSGGQRGAKPRASRGGGGRSAAPRPPSSARRRGRRPSAPARDAARAGQGRSRARAARRAARAARERARRPRAAAAAAAEALAGGRSAAWPRCPIPSARRPKSTRRAPRPRARGRSGRRARAALGDQGARPPPIANATPPPGARRANGATRAGDAERAARRDRRRARWRWPRSAATWPPSPTDHARDRAAERDAAASEARGCRQRPPPNATPSEAVADRRRGARRRRRSARRRARGPRRRGRARRDEEARRARNARISGERFQCPPPLLPERFGFDAADARRPRRGIGAIDRLTAERERIGPVNLVAAEELAELEQSREQASPSRPNWPKRSHRLRGSIGNLNREGRERLRAAFEAGRRAISAACSRACSKAARRISRWSIATIRSRPGSRSSPSRRASG